MTLGSATDPHRGMSAASLSACTGWVFHILHVFPLQHLPVIQFCWATIPMLPLLHVSGDILSNVLKADLSPRSDKTCCCKTSMACAGHTGWEQQGHPSRHRVE